MSPNPLTPKPAKSKPKDTTTLLILSLFLLLLAFFILLNSLASIQEEKSERIMRSVSATFQRNILETVDLTLLVSTFGETPQPNEIIEEIETLWVTPVPVARINKPSNGDLLSIEIETTDLFIPGSTKLRSDREIFLQNLVLTLTKTYPSLDISMQFLLGVDNFNTIETRQVEAPDREALKEARQKLAQEQPVDIYDPNTFADIIPARQEDLISNLLEGKNLSFARATSLGSYLEKQGINKKRIGVGFRKHDPSLIKLRFYVSPPYLLDAKPLQQASFGE